MARKPPEERTIEETIAAAAKKHGVDYVPGAMPSAGLPPDQALLHREDDALREELGGLTREEVARIRLECFQELLGFLFADGPHPAHVVRRIYSVAKAFRPDLVLNMGVREMGKLLGESHAAVSWRVKQVVGKFVEQKTGSRVRLPWEKSDAARAKYSEAQRGNRNRRTSPKTRSGN